MDIKAKGRFPTAMPMSVTAKFSRKIDVIWEVSDFQMTKMFRFLDFLKFRCTSSEYRSSTFLGTFFFTETLTKN